MFNNDPPPPTDPWAKLEDPWTKLGKPTPETQESVSVTGKEKFDAFDWNHEWKFNPDKLHPMTEEELKRLEEANQYYSDVLAEMARKERN